AFSYSVSHDLRAPLRAIDGFSKALLTRLGDRLDPESRSHLGRGRAAAGRMAELIDDLLGLSRVSRGELRLEPGSLTQGARSVFDELRQQSPERPVRFELEPGLAAQADQRLVRVLFENLLGNAWKFSSRKGSATIRVGRLAAATSGPATFFVGDDGAGFDM